MEFQEIYLAALAAIGTIYYVVTLIMGIAMVYADHEIRNVVYLYIIIIFFSWLLVPFATGELISKHT